MKMLYEMEITTDEEVLQLAENKPFCLRRPNLAKYEDKNIKDEIASTVQLAFDIGSIQKADFLLDFAEDEKPNF